jgi:hypothetical protein
MLAAVAAKSSSADQPLQPITVYRPLTEHLENTMNTTAFAMLSDETIEQVQEIKAQAINETAMRQLLDAELFFVGGGAGEVIIG